MLISKDSYFVTEVPRISNSFTVFISRQLELPGRYDKLKAFWEDKKGTLPSSGTAKPLRPSPSSDILPADLKV